MPVLGKESLARLARSSTVTNQYQILIYSVYVSNMYKNFWSYSFLHTGPLNLFRGLALLDQSYVNPVFLNLLIHIAEDHSILKYLSFHLPLLGVYSYYLS